MLRFIPLHFLCTHYWQLVHCIELLPTPLLPIPHGHLAAFCNGFWRSPLRFYSYLLSYISYRTFHSSLHVVIIYQYAFLSCLKVTIFRDNQLMQMPQIVKHCPSLTWNWSSCWAVINLQSTLYPSYSETVLLSSSRASSRSCSSDCTRSSSDLEARLLVSDWACNRSIWRWFSATKSAIFNCNAIIHAMINTNYKPFF